MYGSVELVDFLSTTTEHYDILTRCLISGTHTLRLVFFTVEVQSVEQTCVLQLRITPFLIHREYRGSSVKIMSVLY